MLLLLTTSASSALAQPIITTQPQTQAVAPGAPATFTLGATNPVAHLYVMSPAPLTNREVLDNFDDNDFTGRVEAKGSVIESNQQFNVLGSFPVPTRSMYDSYVIAGHPKTWTVADGMTREWRADLIRLDENATHTAILTVGSDTGGGYIFHKGREFAFLLKWSSSSP